MSTTPATIGKRVQRLRLASGLSQAELAERSRLPTGLISMIENGRQAADSSQLSAMAATIGCNPAYLTRTSPELVSSRPWLRAYADASKRAVDHYIADTLTAIEAVEFGNLRTLPETIPSFSGDPNDDSEIEEYALAVRAAAGFDEADVVGNSMRAAERLGCVLLPMDDELGRHMGLSMRVNGTPVIRVSRPALDEDGNPKPPGDRQRFTVAHEIGHLGLHSNFPPPSTADEAARIERQAHRFAGAFLAPAEPLLEDLHAMGGRVTLTTLSKLKSHWGIAIKALVVRMQNLNEIDANHARSLYKQISARKWNQVEPVPVGNEDAIWLRKALEKTYIRNSSQTMPAIELAAAHSGLDMDFFRRWTDWTTREASPESQKGEVVELRPRRGGSAELGRMKGAAPVTKLPRR